jgi:hypothetical protein
VTGLWAGRPRNRGLFPGRGKWFFFCLDRPWGLPSHLFSWNRRLKRPAREADHLPPRNTEVKIVWSYTLSPHTLRWCGASLHTLHLVVVNSGGGGGDGGGGGRRRPHGAHVSQSLNGKWNLSLLFVKQTVVNDIIYCRTWVNRHSCKK